MDSSACGLTGYQHVSWHLLQVTERLDTTGRQLQWIQSYLTQCHNSLAATYRRLPNPNMTVANRHSFINGVRFLLCFFFFFFFLAIWTKNSSFSCVFVAQQFSQQAYGLHEPTQQTPVLSVVLRDMFEAISAFPVFFLGFTAVYRKLG